MEIAVIGAGIIGSCTAWSLAQKGHNVTLYERHQPMVHTSSVSSKLLHGGLRYLENGQFSLVKKSLQARRFWIEKAPHLCQPLELLFPVYRNNGRKPWKIYTGLKLYDYLASGSGFPKSRWLNKQDVLQSKYPVWHQTICSAHFLSLMHKRMITLWEIGLSSNTNTWAENSSPNIM